MTVTYVQNQSLQGRSRIKEVRQGQQLIGRPRSSTYAQGREVEEFASHHWWNGLLQRNMSGFIIIRMYGSCNVKII
jgi:hypothetical protein